MDYSNQDNWDTLTPEEKKTQLFLRQRDLLNAFLERGAISKVQYDKSLHDLTVKMGMGGVDIQTS